MNFTEAFNEMLQGKIIRHGLDYFRFKDGKIQKSNTANFITYSYNNNFTEHEIECNWSIADGHKLYDFKDAMLALAEGKFVKRQKDANWDFISSGEIISTPYANRNVFFTDESDKKYSHAIIAEHAFDEFWEDEDIRATDWMILD